LFLIAVSSLLIRVDTLTILGLEVLVFNTWHFSAKLQVDQLSPLLFYACERQNKKDEKAKPL